MSNPDAPTSPAPQAAATPANSSDKLLIVLAHVSPLLGVGLILPLILWLVKKGDSENVAYHAKEALNFQITVLLAAIICWLLLFVLVGFVLLPLLMLAALVFTILAAVKSAGGERYRYPFILRLIH